MKYNYYCSLVAVVLYALFQEEIQWAISQIPLVAKIIIALAFIGLVAYQAINNKTDNK